MNNNTITVKTTIDNTEFNKQISEMQKKMKSLRETGPGGAMSQLANQYRSTGQDAKADRMDQFRQRAGKQQRQELQNDLKKQEKLLASQEKHYDNLQKGLKSLVSGSDAYKKKLEEANDALEKHAKISKEIKAANDQVQLGSGRGLPGMGGQSGGFGGFGARDLTHINRSMAGGRGIRGGMKGLGRVMGRNPVMPWAMAGAAMGAVGSAVKTGGNMAFNIGTAGERESASEAGIAGMLGEVADLQSQRRGYEIDYYAPERKKARATAANRMKWSKRRDKTDLAGSAGQMIAGGALMGVGAMTMFAGAALAPFTGGASAAGGYMAGGAMIAGGAGLMGRGAYSVAGNDTQRSMLGGMMGSQSQEDFYEKIKSGEAAEAYKKDLEFQKSKNFDKSQADKFFQKNSKKFLQTQRAFGMSDKDLFLGEDSLMARGTQAGFTTDTTMAGMQAISSGGGTTRASREGGVMASQMARGMNLSNAGQLMGRISGATGGSANESKDELIRMYAEATKIGLDTSEYSKETRAFLQSAADMAFSSGADASDVASGMGMGLNIKSERGVKAAADAFEKIKGQTGQMGGLTGQYQLAELTGMTLGKDKDGKAKSLDMDALAGLSGMDISKVSDKNKYIQGLMDTAGVKIDSEEGQKFISDLKKKKISSTTRTKEQLEKLKKYYQKKQAADADPKNAELQKEASVAYAAVYGSESKIGGNDFANLSEQEKESYIKIKGGYASGAKKADIDKARAESDEKMKKGASGLMGDEKEGAAAMDDMSQLGRLTKHAGDLSTAFGNTTTATVRLGEAMIAIQQALESGNTKAFEQYQDKMKGYEKTQKANERERKRFKDEGGFVEERKQSKKTWEEEQGEVFGNVGL